MGYDEGAPDKEPDHEREFISCQVAMVLEHAVDVRGTDADQH